MNRTVKLILDIVMGAVIPILILNNLSERLGPTPTYVLAGLVPVAWVFIDLLFITKRFNFITSYVGASAIVRGVLVFWFVDGIQFAFKDSAGFIFTAVVFGGSIIIAKPIMYYFLMQALGPNNAEQEKSLKELLEESKVYRALVNGTIIILIINVLTGIANFFLNLYIVTGIFDTVEFNQQVAQVNAITRIALTIPEFIAFGVAFVLIYRAMFQYLPKEDDKEQLESDFWELLKLREAQKSTADS
ncbi:MAG: VC0807 family protein [Chloroflexota bacterium]